MFVEFRVSRHCCQRNKSKFHKRGVVIACIRFLPTLFLRLVTFPDFMLVWDFSTLGDVLQSHFLSNFVSTVWRHFSELAIFTSFSRLVTFLRASDFYQHFGYIFQGLRLRGNFSALGDILQSHFIRNSGFIDWCHFSWPINNSATLANVIFQDWTIKVCNSVCVWQWTVAAAAAAHPSHAVRAAVRATECST